MPTTNGTASASLAEVSLRFTTQITQREIWLLGLAAPLLMFPGWWSVPAVGLIALTWVSRWVSRGRLSVRTPLDMPIVLLLAMSLVGLWASPYPAMAVPKFWGIVLGIAIYYGIANNMERRLRAADVARLFLIATGLVALLSLVGTEWQRDMIVDLSAAYQWIPRLDTGLPGGGVPRASTLFGPREVGGAMAMLLPVPLALCFLGKTTSIRRTAAIMAMGAGAVMLLSQTLLAVSGVLLATLFILARRRHWRAILATLGLASLLFLGVLFVPQFVGPDAGDPWIPHLFERLTSSFEDRVVRWHWALYMLKDMPLTGAGLNAFDPVLVNLYPGFLQKSPFFHAHQFFLQTALDLGIPGVLAFLWLLVGFAQLALRGLKSTSDPDAKALLLGLVGSVIAFMVFGTMDTITLGAKPGALFWAILGMAAGFAAPDPGRVGTHGRAPLPPADHRKPHAWPLLARFPSPPGTWALVLPAVFLAAFGWTFLQGVFYMNLGTIQAHKAIVAEREGSVASRKDMLAARDNLSKALTHGSTSPHALFLMGSLGDRAQDRPEAVDCFGPHNPKPSTNASAERILSIGAEGSWIRTLQD